MYLCYYAFTRLYFHVKIGLFEKKRYICNVIVKT